MGNATGKEGDENNQTVVTSPSKGAKTEAANVVAEKNLMPIQAGDVPATWADASVLHSLTGYRPQTSYREGVAKFISWYKQYYKKC